MKKIILTGIVAFCGLNAAYSQNNASGAPAGTKVMTIEEANRLNGTGQPTINGIPYSQYKAQQDALKNKSKEAATEDKYILTATAISAEQAKAVNTPNKEVVSAPAVPAAKKVSGEYADKTIPGTLYVPTAINAAAVSDLKTTEVAPAQIKMPEQKISQDAQKTDAEIPASVAPAPVKKPAITKQGDN